MIPQNVHTHTTYSDGALPAESMILAAIGKGLETLGFSDHSYTYYEDFTMRAPRIPDYRREISALKVKYADKIKVLCGIEQDINSETTADGYDFVIGSTHSVYAGFEFRPVDGRSVIDTIREYYDGEGIRLAEDYFAIHSQIYKKTRCDIVGHFDVVRRYNNDNALFDTSSKRYRDAAVGALEEILKGCNLFELNTGKLYRKVVTEPYPQAWLLREIRQRGGEIILSSDSHDAESLCYAFDDMEELLKSMGYREHYNGLFKTFA